jgi:simple sugar transport system ATP-binding protein/ribose transport system ATP-binding protein
VLRRLIGELARAGTTVVLVSHFLDEVLEVSDRITVMRDGEVVRTTDASEEDKSSLVRAMIGRQLESAFPKRPAGDLDAPTVLDVRGLTYEGVFRDVDFSVRAGEIVVLAGLVGAGRSEIARCIYGADRATEGQVLLDGTAVIHRHPAQAITNGVAMIPEARKTQGLQLEMSVADNILLPHLRRFSTGGLVRSRDAGGAARSARSDVQVKATSPSLAVQTLSGGNQQKVLFARSFVGQPKVLIADEPTRGVDVGAKRAIYDLLADHAARGMAVLVVSSEIEEVIGLADRVLVVARGRVVAELAGADITEEAIAEAAFDLTRDEPSASPLPDGDPSPQNQ